MIKNYTIDKRCFGHLQGIQGTLPEAEGSGRGLKKSSKSAMGRKELRSEERQRKVGGKREKEIHPPAFHWSRNYIQTESDIDKWIKSKMNGLSKDKGVFNSFTCITGFSKCRFCKG